jgi:hypothetical protein
VSLAGLTASTLYHYRVKSTDAAGNQAVSGDYAFTTSAPVDATPPTISSVSTASLSSTSGTVVWVTDEDSDSQVEYGTTASYGKTVSNSTRVKNHSVGVISLQASTLYHYRVKSKDAAGNLATSVDYTFTTPAPPDTTPPTISGVAVGSITSNGAVVTWTTNEAADSVVDFGLTATLGSSAQAPSLVTAHSVALAGLKESTVYRFRVKSKDAAGNLATSRDATFTTLRAPDTTAPTINEVKVSSVASSKATISWTTNEDSDSQIEYGLTNSYGSFNTRNSKLVTRHAQVISGLSADTKYYYRVRSRDLAGNLSISGEYTVTTSSSSKPASTMYLPGSTTTTTATATQSRKDDLYTGIAIANLGSTEAALTFTALDRSGAPLKGDGLENPSARILKAGSQLPAVDTELFGAAVGGSASLGWIRVDSTSASVAAFYLMFDGQLNVLDGANMLGTPLSTFVLPEVDDQGVTQVNVANPNERDAVVRLDLMRKDGTIRASATRTIQAQGALKADTFADLFPGVVADAGDYIRGWADSPVLPAQILESEGEYLEVLNGRDAAATATVLYSPQFAVGGAWRSAMSVINLDSKPGTVTLRFYGDDSSPIGTEQTRTIPAYGKLYIDDPAFFELEPSGETVQGYVEIRSNGIRVTGSVVFGDPSRHRFSSALPLAASLRNQQTFAHLASNDTYFTGLAILNPNGEDVVATIDVYSSDGTLERTTTQTLRAAHLITQDGGTPAPRIATLQTCRG